VIKMNDETYRKESKDRFIKRHGKICHGKLTETHGMFKGTHVTCDYCKSFWANGNWNFDFDELMKFIDGRPEVVKDD
jgi:hypothetical protein